MSDDAPTDPAPGTPLHVHDQPPVLALIRDLIFATRVTATAKQVGAVVKMIRDPAKLASEQGRRLLVDLNLPGAIDAAAAWGREQHRPVTGFVSHVDKATIAAARAAGIADVMARSQFVQVLADLLSPTNARAEAHPPAVAD